MLQSLLLRRLLAYAADCTVLFLVLAPLGLLAQQTLGVTPESARTIYVALVLNFSLPAWLYFTWGDCSAYGATLGKRLVALETKNVRGRRISAGRALVRTAIKLLPWEITHASTFLLVPALGQFGVASWIGLSLAYVLAFVYLGLAWRTGGHRSMHDFATATRVDWAAYRTDTYTA